MLIQQWGLQRDYPVANFNSHGASAPAITSANAATFTVDVANAFTVTTTGFPRPPIVQTGALPSGVTFVDNGDGTGTLAGTPPAGASGTYPLTFQATNAGGRRWCRTSRCGGRRAVDHQCVRHHVHDRQADPSR